MLLITSPRPHGLGYHGCMNACGTPTPRFTRLTSPATVVHMTPAGRRSSLLILGKRLGFGKETSRRTARPDLHRTGMLWVGWYVSTPQRLRGRRVAANAFTPRPLRRRWPRSSGRCGMARQRQASILVSVPVRRGLVVITPACGFVTPQGSIYIGLAAGTICWFMCYKSKPGSVMTTRWIHSACMPSGTVGAIMTGICPQLGQRQSGDDLKAYVTGSWFSRS